MIAAALRSRARWLIIGVLVIMGVYLLFFTPVRTYIDQRGQMDAAQDRYDLLVSTNKELAERSGRLQTDAEIERIARERYELVSPGQQAYAVMPPQAPPTTAPPQKKNDGLWDKITFWN